MGESREWKLVGVIAGGFPEQFEALGGGLTTGIVSKLADETLGVTGACRPHCPRRPLAGPPQAHSPSSWESTPAWPGT